MESSLALHPFTGEWLQDVHIWKIVSNILPKEKDLTTKALTKNDKEAAINVDYSSLRVERSSSVQGAKLVLCYWPKAASVLHWTVAWMQSITEVRDGGGVVANLHLSFHISLGWTEGRGEGGESKLMHCLNLVLHLSIFDAELQIHFFATPFSAFVYSYEGVQGSHRQFCCSALLFFPAVFQLLRQNGFGHKAPFLLWFSVKVSFWLIFFDAHTTFFWPITCTFSCCNHDVCACSSPCQGKKPESVYKTKQKNTLAHTRSVSFVQLLFYDPSEGQNLKGLQLWKWSMGLFEYPT